MHNWEEDEQGYCTAAAGLPGRATRGRGAGHPAAPRGSFARIPRTGVRRFPRRHTAPDCTPNPDVLCNREIKFGDCLPHAQRLGGELLATGHYARLVTGPDGPELHKAVDAGQGPVLFPARGARASVSPRLLLPLGDLHKARGARAGARGRPAGARQARQHRHLLHRRATVPRIPRAVHASTSPDPS